MARRSPTATGIQFRPPEREQGPGGANRRRRAVRQAALSIAMRWRMRPRAAKIASRCARARPRSSSWKAGRIAGVSTTMGVSYRARRPVILHDRGRSCAARSSSGEGACGPAARCRRGGRRSACRPRSLASASRSRGSRPVRRAGSIAKTIDIAGPRAAARATIRWPTFRWRGPRPPLPPARVLGSRTRTKRHATRSSETALPRSPPLYRKDISGTGPRLTARASRTRSSGFGGQGPPPDLPRAGRHRLRPRSTRTASRRRCRTTSSSRFLRTIPGPRARRD